MAGRSSSPSATRRSSDWAGAAAAGFDEVGIQRRHGKLDGAWKDCVLLEKLLADAARA